MLRLLLRYRRWLVSLPWFKTCYSCEKILPLFMFKKNNKKYKVAAEKGRCYSCNNCVKKRK